jgi:hypothetical protein
LPSKNKKRLTLLVWRFFEPLGGPFRAILLPLARAAIAAATTTAAVATAATTSSIAASPPAAATATVAAAAWWTSLAWTRYIHGQGATFHGFAVELLNSILCILLRAHRHEGKSARLAREFILHKHDILHSTSLREEVLKVGLRRIERKIPNV